jgi:EthD domain
VPYKILIFLKRRPGLSLEEFRDYYEGSHAKLCAKYAVGALRYFRRYVQPLPDPATGRADEMDFDVVTELWFEDRTAYERTLKYAARGILPADVLCDEERLFDRSKARYATIVESESELPTAK